MSEPSPDFGPGTELRRISPGLTLCCMKPEYAECLDRALEAWKEHKKDLKKVAPKYRPSVYGFAYWLIRYSGLVQPTNPLPEPKEPCPPPNSSSNAKPPGQSSR